MSDLNAKSDLNALQQEPDDVKMVSIPRGTLATMSDAEVRSQARLRLAKLKHANRLVKNTFVPDKVTRWTAQLETSEGLALRQLAATIKRQQDSIETVLNTVDMFEYDVVVVLPYSNQQGGGSGDEGEEEGAETKKTSHVGPAGDAKETKRAKLST